MANRTIKLKKSDLISKIKSNKEAHIADYQEAVIAYKKEAEKQLKEQLEALINGNLEIRLNLISPANKSEEYDKIISMFEWETRDEVELTQEEFKEYVLDEAKFAIHSKFLNSTYRG